MVRVVNARGGAGWLRPRVMGVARNSAMCVSSTAAVKASNTLSGKARDEPGIKLYAPLQPMGCQRVIFSWPLKFREF